MWLNDALLVDMKPATLEVRRGKSENRLVHGELRPSHGALGVIPSQKSRRRNVRCAGRSQVDSANAVALSDISFDWESLSWICLNNDTSSHAN